MINERIEIKELNQKIIHGHLTEGDLNILSKKKMYLKSWCPQKDHRDLY